ncbi:hypothetical protein [Lysobacter fragariae]
MSETFFLQLVGLVIVLVMHTVGIMRWLTGRLDEARDALAKEREDRLRAMQTTKDNFDRQLAEIRLETAKIDKAIAVQELNLARQLSQYPTKNEIRDLIQPITAKLETLTEELVRSGLRSTAIHGAFKGG